MHFVHRPGETLQVDFAGGKLGYVEPSTGEWITWEVLVCALPFSHYLGGRFGRSLTLEMDEYFCLYFDIFSIAVRS
jgi:hypothetical protein